MFEMMRHLRIETAQGKAECYLYLSIRLQRAELISRVGARQAQKAAQLSLPGKQEEYGVLALLIPCRRRALFLRSGILVPPIHVFLLVRMRVPADVLLRDERGCSVPFLSAGCRRAHPQSG